jgi:hypothetical protein
LLARYVPEPAMLDDAVAVAYGKSADVGTRIYMMPPPSRGVRAVQLLTLGMFAYANKGPKSIKVGYPNELPTAVAND